MPAGLDAAGENALIGEEGLRLRAYKDSAGLWTIGVGHLFHPTELSSGLLPIAGVAVHWRKNLTRAQAMALLEQDVAWAVADVQRGVTVSLTQGQFNALTSFTFNVGPGSPTRPGFLFSNLLRQLNRGHYDQVPHEMRKWIHAGGKPDPVLAARREREIVLWNAPTT